MMKIRIGLTFFFYLLQRCFILNEKKTIDKKFVSIFCINFLIHKLKKQKYHNMFHFKYNAIQLKFRNYNRIIYLIFMLLALQMFLVSMRVCSSVNCHFIVSSTLITSPEKCSLTIFSKYIDNECNHD